MDYETEEQQIEALKAWWAENGRSVMAGALIGVVAIGGFSFWKRTQFQNAVAASDRFSQSIQALEAGDSDALSKLASEDTGNGTLYSAYTALAAARAAVEGGDLASASRHLREAQGFGGLEEVGIIASVRLARVLTAQGDAEAGLKALPSSYPQAFTGLIEETRGDLLLAAGDSAAAREAYEKARDSDLVTDPAALTMKLNELAVEEAG